MNSIINIFLLTFTMSVSAAGTDDHSHEDSHKDENSSTEHVNYPFGGVGEPRNADRTIKIVMTDNKYDLPSLEVEAGEIIHFKIKNEGQQIHEFTIATIAMHIHHQDVMLNDFSLGQMTMTDKGHSNNHNHANSLLLNPGEAGELTWIFEKADDLKFACNVPGHYQSGMVGGITVQ